MAGLVIFLTAMVVVDITALYALMRIAQITDEKIKGRAT